MQVVRFECPHCSANLKIRETDLVAKSVDCPECHQSIVIGRDPAGNLAARKPDEPSNKGKKQTKAAASSPTEPRATAGASSPRTKSAAPLPMQDSPGKLATVAANRPLLLAAPLIGAAVLGLGVAAITFWPRSRPIESTAIEQPAPQIESKAPTKKTVVAASTLKPANEPPSAASRLAHLGDLLAQYRKKQGNFPAATSIQEQLKPNERLSWLAEIAAGSIYPSGPMPVWIEPWSSPRNDLFVRQQIPDFLNPSLEVRVSPRNYPATHFVGVAGVGEDAADLPVNHPRAGIFGNSRRTRLEDIHDGASNTLMVLGVTNDLGSWAAGGTATVRSLTREPYVNGPDGFGTGQSDRMMVLKADGSVAEMSSTTDPRIFRRMAAISDGLPLDPKIPGEPGDQSLRPTEPAGPIASVGASGPGTFSQGNVAASRPQPAPPTSAPPTSATSAAEPRTPVIAARPPQPAPGQSVAAKASPVDVAAGLAQHIVRFEQAKPIPLQDVLNCLEELLGVSIRGDKHEIADLDDVLQTPITVTLENTTVRQILKEVLAKAGLEFEVEADGIHLHKPQAARASSRP
jgi:hypothetical protein